MIYCKKGGIIDDKEILTFKTEYLYTSKKAIIIFVAKNGIQIQWLFDSIEERDDVFKQIMGHIKNKKEYTEIEDICSKH